MNVAHVVLGLKVGGLERVVVNLVRGLQHDGFKNRILCLEEGGEFAAELEPLGIPIHVLGKKPGMDWYAIRRLAGLLRENRIDVVHTHNPMPHFHGAIARLLARTPVLVHTKHGRNYPDNPRRVLLNRALSWFTDMIVPVSDNAAQVALEIERVAAHKVRRIWNGVDTELYKPGTMNSETGTSVIGTVARLSPEKDQQTMLAAFKLVLEKIPQARLVFVGDGPSVADLKQTTAQLGMGDNVDFLGMRSNVAELLNTFDLFTLSSVTEGISMTLLEAMACELPVAATDVGGNREIVNPPECGLIVPPRDSQALANAYLELLHNPQGRANMGQAARVRVIEHFSLNKMISDYETLYSQLLTQKRILIPRDV